MTERLKKLRNLLSGSVLRVAGAVRSQAESTAVTLAFVGGLGAVAAGVGLVYLPAGLIVGGLLSSACAGMYAKGRL